MCNIEQGTITSSCISIIYRYALIILKASSRFLLNKSLFLQTSQSVTFNSLLNTWDKIWAWLIIPSSCMTSNHTELSFDCGLTIDSVFLEFSSLLNILDSDDSSLSCIWLSKDVIRNYAYLLSSATYLMDFNKIYTCRVKTSVPMPSQGWSFSTLQLELK